MEGLTPRDMDVLGHYARQGNRERYWNYLARHEGADGYGLLALGAVRNDNTPGAVANLYAQNYAYSRNHTILSERGWEEFGQDLVRVDYARRAAHFNGGAPELALNLPVKDVQETYTEAFARKRIDADAWTPNRLLDAARRHGGEAATEGAWRSMLDDGRLGAWRGYDTLTAVVAAYGDDEMRRAEYVKDMGVAYAGAMAATPQVDPDRIQRGDDRYAFDPHSRQWQHDAAGPVTDPKERAELDDARQVRLERAQKAGEIHPADRFHELAASPFALSERISSAQPMTEPAAAKLAARDIAPALYDELKPQLPVGLPEERLAQVTLAAKEGGIKAGHVRAVLVENGTVYIAGRIPGMLGQVDLAKPAPPLQESLQRSAALDQRQEAQAAPQGPKLG
ncbi:hypothetical protein KK141_20365 [Dyella sp. LX-66]|uniref:hypothetical protein n=1 Tax=unclassified Dyella TaxID=2634549 RepID=UPI001BE0608F|nr:MULTISPECIES: hypothetical protein [unclassified Dyella]MBT2118416.1 hypothetical protein [Dyella sp. LX-1]MBT2141912.1 hypothetical protein [Dyella sp. LX-66]